MSAIAEATELKKRGRELPDELVSEAVRAVASDTVPDYRVAALLMAIYIQGMTVGETVALTRAMAESGATYQFPDCLDKHSTGGVGDKISLASLPLAAACGVPVVKLAGRGLGFAGGTIDKLESIPGVRCGLSGAELRAQVDTAGIAIAEAGDAAPADAALYSLREVTGTVDSLPLIASSIVSKKAAIGAGAVLYDVKRGRGAFMATEADARELAKLLVLVSAELGIRATARVSAMDEPLGTAVGNRLEVLEAARFLRGEPVASDFGQLARAVAVDLLELKGVSDSRAAVERAIRSGAGFKKLSELVRGQGGRPDALERLTLADERWHVTACAPGTVAAIDARRIGEAALALGAGRTHKGEPVRPDVGVELLAKAGDGVHRGQLLAAVYGGRQRDLVQELITSAFELL